MSKSKKPRQNKLTILDRILIPLDILLYGDKALDPFRNCIDQRANVGVYYNNTFMKVKRGTLGATLIKIPKSKRQVNECELGIIIDREMFHYPSNVLEFTIQHEIGHHETFHKMSPEEYRRENSRRVKNINEGRVSKPELYADEYAASIIGYDSVISALSFLANHARLSIARDECKMRIDHLIKIQEEDVTK